MFNHLLPVEDEDALEDSIGTFDEDTLDEEVRMGLGPRQKKRPPKIWISKSASMEHDLD